MPCHLANPSCPSLPPPSKHRVFCLLRLGLENSAPLRHVAEVARLPGGTATDTGGVVVLIAAEEVHDLLEAELQDVLLHASLNSRLREKALLLLQGEDTLFNGLLDGDFVDDDVDLLRQAMNTIDGLLLDELEHA